MLAVRLDEELRITWLSDDEKAMGRLRVGARVGEAGLTDTAGLVAFGRAAQRAMCTGGAQAVDLALGSVLMVPDAGGCETYTSSRGAVLMVPADGLVTAYLVPERFEVASDARYLRGQLIERSESLEDEGDPV